MSLASGRLLVLAQEVANSAKSAKMILSGRGKRAGCLHVSVRAIGSRSLSVQSEKAGYESRPFANLRISGQFCATRPAEAARNFFEPA